MQDKDPITFKGFNGTFNRGDIGDCPNDHLWSSLNCQPLSEGIGPRDGFNNLLTITSNVIRVRVFETSSFRRYFILKSGGNLYDSIDMVNPILAIGTMTDFAVEVINDRAYISPHNGVTGLSGQSLYVYDRALATTARAAAGSAPSTQVTLAVGGAGRPEIGVHIVAYSYEYNTGFITAPGGHNSITLAGHTIINASTIANGPANVVKKWIWMSKAQLNWDGNLTTPELFLVGTINDNVTTTFNIDVYDTQLISSADEYLDRLATIPAGVSMCVFQGRLVIVGENANKGYARISNPGAPESFSSTDGFVPCFKGDLGWLKNCVEDNGVLYLFRLDYTYSTFDNGGPPNTWKCTRVAPVGTGPEGVGVVFSTKGKAGGYFLIMTRYGLARFNGLYDPIPMTWKIENKWNVFESDKILKYPVTIDPIQERVYFIQSVSVNTPVVWMGDYKKGLDFQSIRWYQWEIATFSARDYHSLFVIYDYTQLRSSLIISTAEGPYYQIWKRQYDYNGSEFDEVIDLPLIQGTLGSTLVPNNIVFRTIATRSDLPATDFLAWAVSASDELGVNILNDLFSIIKIPLTNVDANAIGTDWMVRYGELLRIRECRNIRLILKVLRFDQNGNQVDNFPSGLKLSQVDVHVGQEGEHSPYGAQ